MKPTNPMSRDQWTKEARRISRRPDVLLSAAYWRVRRFFATYEVCPACGGDPPYFGCNRCDSSGEVEK